MLTMWACYVRAASASVYLNFSTLWLPELFLLLSFYTILIEQIGEDHASMFYYDCDYIINFTENEFNMFMYSLCSLSAPLWSIIT